MATERRDPPAARLEGSRLELSGRLDSSGVAKVWNTAVEAAAPGVEVEASQVGYCDGAGVALLWELRRRGARINGLSGEVQKLLEPFGEARPPEAAGRKKTTLIETIGHFTGDFLQDLRDQVKFLGQTTVIGIELIFRPAKMRWGDVWLTFQRAGVQALVIVGMISFLTGMIMAFQSAVPLKQFGVDIFVVNLVALAMLRELGPIMTAIVLAGRSGSAFAAEIGTMKVNEEINALTTMGLDPVRFLVAPRMLAGIMVTPLLTIYSDLLGVAGGFFVMVARGFPVLTLWRQLVSAVEINDVMAGLIKAFVFGALVAGIGCLRGLQTKAGASAVGVSTTRAVVSGIFLIVVIDAIFAAVFYALKF